MQINKKMWPIHGAGKAVNRNCPLGSRTLDLLNQDIKSDILNMFKELNNERKNKGTISQQIENTNKEISIIKKNQIETLELKDTITKKQKCSRQTQQQL